MREGLICLLRTRFTNQWPKNSIVCVQEVNLQGIWISKLTPLHGGEDPHARLLVNLRDLQILHNVNHDDVRLGNVGIVPIPTPDGRNTDWRFEDYRNRVKKAKIVELGEKEQLYNNRYGSKGHNIVDFSIDELKRMFKYIPVQYNYTLGFYNPETKNILLRCRKDNKSRKETIMCIPYNDAEAAYIFNPAALNHYCDFRVKSYERSSKLFHFTNVKKESVGKIVEATKLELRAQVKKSEQLENTVYVKIGESNYRFVLDDIEIIYPNVNGWNPEKDRSISVGKTIKVINDKHLVGVKKNDKILVNDLKKVGNKMYVGFSANGKTTYERSNKFKAI